MRLMSIAGTALFALTLAGCVGTRDNNLISLDVGSELPPGSAQMLGIDPSAADQPFCFQKIYVPAVYKIETRGRLLRPAETRYEVVTVKDKTQWSLVRDPAVYLEGRHLVEPDHYSLHLVRCAAKAERKPEPPQSPSEGPDTTAPMRTF